MRSTRTPFHLSALAATALVVTLGALQPSCSQKPATTEGRPPEDGSVLPFPPAPMAGVAKPRLQDSTPKWPAQPQRLPKDAPNILIVLIDDVGFGTAEPFGGEIHTPTLSRLANEGLR